MDVHATTRFLIVSDTHGVELDYSSVGHIDVAIHCGDLTEESKLDEYRASIRLLKTIEAPLKLVIAGNHDFTLDREMFVKKCNDIEPPVDGDLLKRLYGDYGEARELFEAEDAKATGIRFLDEGTHRFTLANGALLTVFASPYTPSPGDWGFQYHPQIEHDWPIRKDTDIVITHGPPRGVMDYTDSRERAGSLSLFAAVARARPRVHCFGHIHEGWGAKLVTWRNVVSETPSHFTDIDNERSFIIEKLSRVHARKHDTPDVIKEKLARLRVGEQRGYYSTSTTVQQGSQTLFINAAVQGTEHDTVQLPWVVDLGLPKAIP